MSDENGRLDEWDGDDAVSDKLDTILAKLDVMDERLDEIETHLQEVNLSREDGYIFQS